MRIGIYSGSFNPVHIGHIALADYIISQQIVDEIWLIRTPQNPLKPSNFLLNDELRAQMLEIAVQGHKGLKVSTIEDSLPKPNYTINTLKTLSARYPEHSFYLIIGADNWNIFDKWRDYQTILDDYNLIVYPRPGYELTTIDKQVYPNVQVINAPLYNISSTDIRDGIKEGKDVSDKLDTKVLEFIQNNNLYKD